ncbi:hypothetical protein M422DRAFT_29263 [Sphaerobolus stellatus SS14]|nr:hypothetical protein M422DRAFT_29263 [Sphaerobolus stellatus SS14]
MLPSLQSQPFDILNIIATYLDSPKDLLSLALNGRQFYRVVCPTHLEFRYIRCDPHRISLWETISEHAEIAKRFRRIELYEEAESNGDDYPLLPWSWKPFIAQEFKYSSETMNPDTSIGGLVNSIGKLTNLLRFSWIFQRGVTAAQLNAFPAIFNALAVSCPSLREISVHISGGTGNNHALERDLKHLEHEFPSVKSISLKFKAFHISLRPLIVYLIVLTANRCPVLTDMYIGFRSPMPFDYAVLFAGTNWPFLRRLTLNIESPEVPNPLPEEVLAAYMRDFFSRHQHIECLDFGIRPSIPPGVLSVPGCPSLRSLRFYETSQPDPLRIVPRDLVHQLTYISVPEITKFLITYGKNSMPSLQGTGGRIYDGQIQLMTDVLPLASIEHLDFWLPMPDYGDLTGNIRIQELQVFYKLKYLAGFVMVPYADDIEDFPVELLSKLASIPSLKFVEVCQYDTRTRSLIEASTWIELDREYGEFVGFHPVEDLSRSIPSRIRGGFFEDLDP